MAILAVDSLLPVLVQHQTGLQEKQGIFAAPARRVQPVGHLAVLQDRMRGNVALARPKQVASSNTPKRAVVAVIVQRTLLSRAGVGSSG